jgi:transmembrane sensor
MKYNQEHIFQLILEKVLNSISEDDDRYLTKAMAKHKNIRDCWLDFEEARRHADDTIVEDINNEVAWSKVLSILNEEEQNQAVLPPLPVSNSNYGWWWAAAATILTIVGSAYFVRHHSSQQPKIANALPGNIKIPDQSAANLLSSIQPVISRPATTDTMLHMVLPAVIDSNTISSKKDTVVMLAKTTVDDDMENTIVQWNTLTVPPKIDYKIELPDGTEVHLNAASTLRFPFIFTGKTREVYLEGEAFFTVAHNPDKPFIVHTGSTSVKALGTAFNVNTYEPGQITTSLVQGSVITDVGDSLDVILKPGYQAIYKTGERFKVEKFNEAATLSWRNGIYSFDQETLNQLDPIIRRWFGLKVAFDTPSLAEKLFSGSILRDKPVGDFLDALIKENKNIEYYILEGTIHFRTPITRTS